MMRKNNGVSAVIGVILMVAITVAIAAALYYYVSVFVDDQGTVIMEARGTFLGAVNDNGSCDLLFMSDNGSEFALHDMKGVDLSILDGFVGRGVVCRYKFNTVGENKFLGMYLDSDRL